MNFEPKDIIRWGIPGWMFLAVLIAYFSLNDFDSIKSFIFNKDAPIIVASITLFIVSGVTIGNLIHQISLSLGFIIWKDRKKHLKHEYELDKIIIENQYGKEIQRIYSDRLGNLHALSALCFSLFLSLLTIGIFSFTIKFSTSIMILLIIVFLLNVIVFHNLIYFQDHLNYYIRKVKSDFKASE
ncbi:hypothetical protein BIV60_27365 [Bacillus sp. MUM 116]|uniref:hypothetical protein n=1 Tax=Bacillus sp. MUM 116 TaxID=1678002 RepID=UPI0008F5E23E|nr:hypothetical protein [Bacillus sp. MUM 116]OIK06279.1 hypothetical protein BIV60_27365 [Bacillus sp. MUM 116]